MILYQALYKKLGINTLAMLKDPPVYNSDNLTLPMESEFLWYKPSDNPDVPTPAIGYLKNVMKPNSHIVVTKYLYNEAIGSPKDQTKRVKELVSKQSKANPDIIFLPPNSNLKVSKNITVIYSYGSINSLYVYPRHTLDVYYKWYNSFNSLVLNIIKSMELNTRHSYINIDLPSNIPTYKVFTDASNGVNTKTVTLFPTYKHMTLLELWNFIDVKSSSSILKKIPKEGYKNITLVFNYDNKIVLLNLWTLYAFIKENKEVSNIKHVASESAKKLLLIFLNKFIQKAWHTAVDEEDNVDTAITVDEGDKTEPLTDSELDDEINDIEDTKSVKYEDLLEEDDSLVNGVIIDPIKEYDTLEAVLADKGDQDELILNRVNAMKENNVLSRAEEKKIKELLDKQKSLSSPFNNGRTLKDELTYTKEDLEIPKESSETPDIAIIKDKETLKTTVKAMDKKYITELYSKDITSVVYSLQNSGIMVDNYTIETDETVMGGTEIHTFEVKPLRGGKSTVRIALPKINADGTFKVSGNEYTIIKQSNELPIRKISATKVGITTAYGKTFIEKADVKAHDIGYWFMKKVLADSKLPDSTWSNLVLLPAAPVPDIILPNIYKIVARYMKIFRKDGVLYNLDYLERYKVANKNDSNSYEDTIEKNGKYILIGRGNGFYVVIDTNDVLYKYKDGKYTEMFKSIYDMANITMNSAPVEHAVVKVFKKRIPVAVLLSYYLGFNNLLKLLKVKYKILGKSERYTLQDNEYVVTFSDNKFIFDRTDKLGAMILGGFTGVKNDIKDIDYKLLNTKEHFPALFNSMNLPILYINEIKLMETMMVDPISKTILEEMKEPTTWKGLLVRASEMLLTENHKHEADMSEGLVKGYDRIANMVYGELVDAARDFENRNVFSKAKLTVDPYSVSRTISNDPTTMLIDDLNPVSYIKQNDGITKLGAGGRSKDSLPGNTRSVHKSHIGLISEASVDSAMVGIRAQVSVSPNFATMRGNLKQDKDKKLSPANIFSTSAMLSVGGNTDDPKRLLFVDVQNGHTIAMDSMKVVPVRSSYEAVMPYRVPEKYAYMAEQDGVVKKVTPFGITLAYKNGEVKTVKLGHWSSKEEAKTSYLRTIRTDLSVEQKFKRGDAISYDDKFFEQDLFEPNRVVYKTGTTLKVAIKEDPDTFEDSHVLHRRAVDKVGTSVLKSKVYILSNTDDIINLVKPKQNVEVDTLLFTIYDPNLAISDDLSDKTIGILQNIANKSPKAKLRGVVHDIRLLYNCEYEELSDTLKEIADTSNKAIKNENNNNKLDGRVNNTYSVDGKKLAPGQVMLKIRIVNKLPMGLGDKGVFGNQLKTVLGEIIDYPIKTVETNEDIDALFGNLAIAARIVNSPGAIGSSNTLMYKLNELFTNAYFGDSK